MSLTRMSMSSSTMTMSRKLSSRLRPRLLVRSMVKDVGVGVSEFWTMAGCELAVRRRVAQGRPCAACVAGRRTRLLHAVRPSHMERD